MTLKEFMESADPDNIYSVGASSSYFFIGTSRGFSAYAQKLDKKAKANLSKTFMKKVKQLEEVLASGPVGIENLGEVYTSVVSCAKQTCKAIRDYESYKPIVEEEVSETYKRKGSRGIAVIIDRNLAGKYWTHEEFIAEEGEI